MAIKLPSHLHRSRSGVLHFRIAIPSDLRHHFTSREVYRSLQTASVRDATDAAQNLSIAFKRIFNQIRQQTMCDQENPAFGPVIDPAKLGELTRLTKQRLRYEDKIEVLAQDAAELKIALLRQQKQHERELALILKAKSTASVTVAAAGASPHFPKSPSVSAPLISSYVDAYLKSAPADQRPNEKSLEAYRAAINTFIKIIGDKALNAISIHDQNRFEDVIMKLPVNYTKVAAARGLPIDDMLKLGLPTISLQNAKNIAQRTNVFLSWAFRRAGAKVPFQLLDNLRLTKKRKIALKRRAFTDDELRLVFNPLTLGTSTQASPYMFWIPLIGAHSGMRINEIAQFLLSDLVLRDGIHCFNVTESPDQDDVSSGRTKTVKTEAGKRVVPIHTRLIELGLLKYAETLREARHTQLFPDLEGGRDGPGQPASKQFARYCDRIKLTDPELVFHSFRHGAVGRMRSAKVQKELRMVVVGHSAAEDTHDTYGDIKNDYSIADKFDAIKALNFDLVIEYERLKTHAPSLTDLVDALLRLKKLKNPPSLAGKKI